MSNTVLDESLDYSKYYSTHPTYQYFKVQPMYNTGQINLTANGGDTTQFEIPASVFNFAKSYMTYTVGAPPAPAEDRYSRQYIEGFPHITQIQV